VSLFLPNRKNHGFNNSEGFDSTRGLEIIRPTETLPLNAPHGLDPNGDKMSMICEEDYHVENGLRSAFKDNFTEKSQRTTSDNIMDFRNHFTGQIGNIQTNESGHNRFFGNNMMPQRTSGFIPVQELDNEGEDDYLSSKCKLLIR